MGKLKFFGLLLAAGMFAACSDNLENGGTGNEGGANGTGYVKISLNLPSTSGGSTRADSENDDFNHGSVDEYNVEDVILALFYGTDESNATCKWATTLITSFNAASNDPSNITTTSTSVVSEVPQPDEGQSIYALAIINGKDYFGISNNELTFDANATSKETFIGETLSDLFNTASPVAIDKIANTTDGGYFMMTNAPISDKASAQSTVPDWNPQITTLVKLNYYEDESTAEKTTPDPIYVERVVAKVNVKINDADDNGSNTLSIKKDDGQVVGKVTFDKWALQTTNKKTYLVRKASQNDLNTWKTYYNTEVTSKENRFVGEVSGPYRTYWGIDPNYNLLGEADLNDNFNIWTKAAEPTDNDWFDFANNLSDGESAYCAENTTIAKAMQQDQLTGVLLRATYKNAEGDAADIFTYGNVSTIYPAATMLQTFENTLGLNSGDLKLVDKAVGAIITTKDGLNSVITKKDGTLSDEQCDQLLATYSPIKFYADGETFYYASLIKHFGDVYTPIKPDQNIVNLDDYEEADHLGRWGVVRNNWYELIINSVSGLGEPEIPDNPQLPGDTENRYINCSINVLSWAKRSQGVDL